MVREASCVWPVTAELIIAIDHGLGPPVDSYINGAQTWFTDEPVLGDITLEWRLHPVANFEAVVGITAEDRWDLVVAALSAPGADVDAIPLGAGVRSLHSLWDGLECFGAYGDECEPAPLARAASERIGIAPAACGLVDHETIAEEWERARGALSITEALLGQLAPSSE